MPGTKVQLKYTPGCKQIYLRDFCGMDELNLKGTGSLDAIHLLDALLLEIPNIKIGPGNANQIAIADRDRIYSTLYSELYDDKIESTIRCRKCESLFDLNFSLKELIQHLENQESKHKITFLENGIFQLNEKKRFRLPTGKDEFEVFGLGANEAETKLIQNCILGKFNKKDSQIVQEAMQEVAPLISSELLAVCVECGEQHEVNFEIQSYLLTAILNEQKTTAREIHRIASSYGWNLEDIKSLARKQRKEFVRLIETEMGII